MAHYVIGDVQGCYDGLSRLLDKVQFDDQTDVLWFTGDLVNRGHQSLDVLRLVYSLKGCAHTVLGNHDLHLLAVYYEQAPHKEHTFDDVLDAADVDVFACWLREQPFFMHYADMGYAMMHAGVHPRWSLQQALSYNDELQALLQGDNFKSYLAEMYGNEPAGWSDDLKGLVRSRVLTNYFTRLRLCDDAGVMNFSYKGSLEGVPGHLMPWFSLMKRNGWPCELVFGHWAALRGVCDVSWIHALDTGYVWGDALTAMRLEDKALFCVEHPDKS